MWRFCALLPTRKVMNSRGQRRAVITAALPFSSFACHRPSERVRAQFDALLDFQRPMNREHTPSTFRARRFVLCSDTHFLADTFDVPRLLHSVPSNQSRDRYYHERQSQQRLSALSCYRRPLGVACASRFCDSPACLCSAHLEFSRTERLPNHRQLVFVGFGVVAADF